MKEQMKYLKLSKEEMANLLDELRREFRVVAPVRREGLILFEEIGSGKEAQLDFGNSRKSPKDFFFPQMEVLFSYQLSDNELKIEEPQPEPRKTVIFGMRPCDARALLLLDKIFLEGEVQDSNYRRRREENIILALGCTHPRRTCFCTSVGGNPFGTEGIDALFIDLGKTYVVEVLTQKGEELLRDRLSEADEESLKSAERVKREAESSMGPQVKAKELADLNLLEIFEDSFWDRVHEKCLGCGICTYLCPTCSCFDVIDEKTDSGGERIRLWDSCLYPLFTLQASGVNPRPTGRERMRQRVLHKFKYFADEFGQPSCVGCGRCVVSCPVNLDIRQVVNELVGGKA